MGTKSTKLKRSPLESTEIPAETRTRPEEPKDSERATEESSMPHHHRYLSGEKRAEIKEIMRDIQQCRDFCIKYFGSPTATSMDVEERLILAVERDDLTQVKKLLRDEFFCLRGMFSIILQYPIENSVNRTAFGLLLDQN